MKNTSPEMPSHWLPTKSSVLTRVPHDQRRVLNKAIIYRQLESYRKLYDHFELAAFNVSYTAFYYYARRIRTAATLAELRQPSADPDRQAHQILPDILAENLLDAALDVEKPSSLKIARLARAYRVTQLALVSRHTLAAMRQQSSHAIANKTGLPTGPRKRPYDIDAPWNRDDNGRPYTEEEFRKALFQSVREIYGLNLPENYGRERESPSPSQGEGRGEGPTTSKSPTESDPQFSG